MQDASMRSQMGLEEQGAVHVVQATSSVIPTYGALSGTDGFLGRKIAPGARPATQATRLDPDG